MKLNVPLILMLIASVVLVLLVVNGQGCEQRECYNNQDCIKVQITCCPCNMGGTEKCVPRLMANVYQEKLKDCPPQEQLVCTALYNCKEENCSCIKGKCIEE